MTGRHVDYAELRRKRTASRTMRDLELPAGVICVPYGPGEWATYTVLNGCTPIYMARDLNDATPEQLAQWAELVKLAPKDCRVELWLTRAQRGFLLWRADDVTFTLLGRQTATPTVAGLSW